MHTAPARGHADAAPPNRPRPHPRSACVLTPPVASMGANYVKQYSDGVYGPFQFVLQVGRGSSIPPPCCYGRWADR